MMTKTDGWVVRFLWGLELLVASLFLFMSPSSSQETTKNKAKPWLLKAVQTPVMIGISGMDPAMTLMEIGLIVAEKVQALMVAAFAMNRVREEIRTAVGLDMDGGSSSSAGEDASPPHEGGSGDSTGPGLGNGCAWILDDMRFLNLHIYVHMKFYNLFWFFIFLLFLDVICFFFWKKGKEKWTHPNIGLWQDCKQIHQCFSLYWAPKNQRPKLIIAISTPNPSPK